MRHHLILSAAQAIVNHTCTENGDIVCHLNPDLSVKRQKHLHVNCSRRGREAVRHHKTLMISQTCAVTVLSAED